MFDLECYCSRLKAEAWYCYVAVAAGWRCTTYEVVLFFKGLGKRYRAVLWWRVGPVVADVGTWLRVLFRNNCCCASATGSAFWAHRGERGVLSAFQ